MHKQAIDPPELHSCFVKLGRAQTRINDLATGIMDFRQPQPYRLVREEQPTAGNSVDYIYCVEVLRTPPSELSATIGEVLYNIHSALDHLANRLGERAGNTRHITFPIFKNRAKFWRENKDGSYHGRSGAIRLMQMPEDARGLVADLQPYQRGDEGPQHPLWLLHELSNADKHHALHLMGAALTDTIIKAVGENAITELRWTNYGPFNDGDKIACLRLWVTGPNPQMKFNTKFATTEAFAEPGPAAGLNPANVLHKILGYVIDEVFDKRFVPYFSF